MEKETLNSVDALNLQFVRLIGALRDNTHAYDDDLEESWAEFINEWNITKSMIEKFIGVTK